VREVFDATRVSTVIPLAADITRTPFDATLSLLRVPFASEGRRTQFSEKPSFYVRGELLQVDGSSKVLR
jgi:hypothetical protein